RTTVNTDRTRSEVNTARPKVILKAVRGNLGNPQHSLKDQGIFDSGCSRHMTGNMSFLSKHEEINGRYVTFGGDAEKKDNDDPRKESGNDDQMKDLMLADFSS
ncbi:hypothetical protein Tco_1350371, partial [Tanacetum coccineum]